MRRCVDCCDSCALLRLRTHNAVQEWPSTECWQAPSLCGFHHGFQELHSAELQRAWAQVPPLVSRNRSVSVGVNGVHNLLVRASANVSEGSVPLVPETLHQGAGRRKIATGWLVWVAWVGVVLGVGAVGLIVETVRDPGSLRRVIEGAFTLPDPWIIWVLQQLIAILLAGACIGLLLGRPIWGRIAVGCCWLRVVLDLGGASLGLARGELMVPVTIFLYGGMAIAFSRALRRSTEATQGDPAKPTG